MFLKASTLVSLLAAVHVTALPSAAAALPEADEGLAVLETLDLGDGGAITYYGVDPASANATTAGDELDPKLNRRCGSNAVVCSNSNVPALNTCNELVSRIRTSSHTVGNTPRSICLSRNGKNCCISWNKDLGNVSESKFYNAAKKTMDACVTEARSGLANDVSINGKCLRQCLSNRATGC